MACPDRLSQWTKEVSTAFAHSKQTANLGIGALERRHRVVRSGRDHSNQCSARLSAARTGTNGVSALTRVVSGCRAKEWEKAA